MINGHRRQYFGNIHAIFSVILLSIMAKIIYEKLQQYMSIVL